MRGYGPAGPDYFVLVTAKLRVCAATGAVTVSVRERKYLGQEADPFAENFRSVRHRHPRRCGWHLVDWTLGDSFFGIGTYQVRLRVGDRFDRESRSVFRTFETLD